MKNVPILLSAVLFITACTSVTEKKPQKIWLGKEFSPDQIREGLITYHMFDSTEKKVGSMVYEIGFEDGVLIARDTSLLDDGSIYETAQFEMDTSDFSTRGILVNMKVAPNIELKVDCRLNHGRVQGTYLIRRDTLERSLEIDSLYDFHVVRSELYSLLHSIKFSPGDTLSFSALAPTSMQLSEASIVYEGEERVEVPAGAFNCTVIRLLTDGAMPENRIWISNKERRIIKFYVPGPELSIELFSFN